MKRSALLTKNLNPLFGLSGCGKVGIYVNINTALKEVKDKTYKGVLLKEKYNYVPHTQDIFSKNKNKTAVFMGILFVFSLHCFLSYLLNCLVMDILAIIIRSVNT